MLVGTEEPFRDDSHPPIFMARDDRVTDRHSPNVNDVAGAYRNLTGVRPDNEPPVVVH